MPLNHVGPTLAQRDNWKRMVGIMLAYAGLGWLRALDHNFVNAGPTKCQRWLNEWLLYGFSLTKIHRKLTDFPDLTFFETIFFWLFMYQITNRQQMILNAKVLQKTIFKRHSYILILPLENEMPTTHSLCPDWLNLTETIW